MDSLSLIPDFHEYIRSTRKSFTRPTIDTTCSPSRTAAALAKARETWHTSVDSTHSNVNSMIDDIARLAETLQETDKDLAERLSSHDH